VQDPLIGVPFSHQNLRALLARLRGVSGAGVRAGEGDRETDASTQKLLRRVCDNVLELGKHGCGRNKDMDCSLGHVAVTAAVLGDAPRFHQAVERTREAWAEESVVELGGIIDPQDPPVNEKEYDFLSLSL
jgi:hypothetical protein